MHLKYILVGFDRLDQNTNDLVKFIAPVFDKHGEIPTKHFYIRLFEKKPEPEVMSSFATA